MSPEIDTEYPNWSNGEPSVGRSFCCSVQDVPERTKTKAELFEGALSRSLLVAPVATMDEVVRFEQLASRDYREREKANKALNALGDRALPHLKAAMAKSDSPEAQRRLEVMVTRMERELFLAPSRVSLKAKNQPMKATLNA